MVDTRKDGLDEVKTASVSAEARAPDSAQDRTAKGIPAIAEAFGYIGGALAVAAVAALMITFWSQMGIAGHVGIGVALALAGLLGGFALRRAEGEAAKRLSGFLLFAGVAGVGAAVGFAVHDVLVAYVAGVSPANASEWGWFTGASALALSGGLVWWRERSILQHLAFGVGVAGAALLALPLIPIEGPDWGAGATLVLVALVWGALSLRDLIPPRTEGLVLSALGIFGGIEMMVLPIQPALLWAMWLGAVSCAALIWAGSRMGEMGVLGIGTVGLMVFSGQLVGEYLGFGAGTAIALIAVGFVLLGMAVRFTLAQTPEATLNRRVASEVAGYLGVALAMGGAGILLARSWDTLGVAGRILVPLVGAAVAYTCAVMLGRSELPAARRLSQTLLAIGVLSAGITGAMVARPITENVFGQPSGGIDYADSWIMLAGAVTATAVGGITWWFRKGSLTQIAFASGIVMIVITAFNFLAAYEQSGVARAFPDWAIAALLVAVGTLWVVLGAREQLPPTRTALAVGCYVCLQGFQMMVQGTDGIRLWAALLAIGYSVAAIAASIWLKRAILLGFGAIGIMMFTTVTVMEQFAGSAGAPIALLVAGVIFIGLAVMVAKVAPRIRRTPSDPKTPQMPPSPFAHA